MSGSICPAERAARPPRLLYLCMETMAPGSAAATHVGEIVAGLRRRGFDVKLVAREENPASPLLKLARYRRLGNIALGRLFGSDAVYVRSHFAAWPIAGLARLFRLPVLHEINGTYGDVVVTHPVLRRVAALLAWSQRWQYRHAAALIAVTPGLARWARAEAGHERIHFIGNAANTDLFRPEGERTRRARPYMLFFGGLTRWHGVPTMLAAFRHPDWPAGLDLVVAGPVVDGSLEEVLADAPPGVVRLGRVPQSELPALVRGALATLVPISDPSGRSAEGVLPLKLFEGLACGVPAIVTDLPGQADLVRQAGCGIVVPVDDPGALAAAVARLAADPDETRRMGEAGATVVAERHSWDRAAAETAEVIRAAIRASR